MRLTARPDGDGFMGDLLFLDGSVAVAAYGTGPTELLAQLVAQQRPTSTRHVREGVKVRRSTPDRTQRSVP
jgi:hypothetical protein